MIEFLPFLIPTSLSALVAIASLFLYFKTRKTGFALIGIGFLLITIPTLVTLALGGPYIPVKLYEKGFSVAEIGEFIFLLGLLDMSLTIVFALLVLIGLVLFMRDFKK